MVAAVEVDRAAAYNKNKQSINPCLEITLWCDCGRLYALTGAPARN